jgi:hypothetical protein
MTDAALFAEQCRLASLYRVGMSWAERRRLDRLVRILYVERDALRAA